MGTHRVTPDDEGGVTTTARGDSDILGSGELDPRLGCLSDIRVVDLTSVVAGPHCTALMGDMGADVIKVEHPAGDIARGIGPRRSEGMAAQHLNLNRNKRFVTLDLKTDAGRSAVIDLVQSADVFISNMRLGALERLRLAWQDLSAVNPTLVYCRIGGFDGSSPDRDRPAIDDVLQAVGGMVWLQEQLTGEPAYVATAFADAATAVMALAGVLAALHRRTVTGRGEEVQVSMYATLVSVILTTHLGGHAFRPPLGPAVNPRTVARSHRPFRTADGAICIAATTDGQWHRLCDLLERPELMREERFANVFERSQNFASLYELIEPMFCARGTDAWCEALDAADVPYARVRTTEEVLADPDLLRTGLLRDVEHETEGALRLATSPIQFTETPGSLHHLPGRLGSDTRSVMREVGWDESRIEQLLDTL